MCSAFKKGATLIELIVFIVVLGIAIPTLLGLFMQANYNTVDSEVVSNTTYVAEELMEEIRSKEYDDPDQTPGFGPESGETDRSSYDDVDDYNGYSDIPTAGYTRLVTVEYAQLSGSTWESAAGTTDYKKVTVVLQRTDDATLFASLVIIVSDH